MTQSRFRLEMECENAAFEDRGAEIARILRRLAKRIEDVGDAAAESAILDINGNTVGRWFVTAREEEDTGG